MLSTIKWTAHQLVDMTNHWQGSSLVGSFFRFSFLRETDPS